jgi:hypothetical protein
MKMLGRAIGANRCFTAGTIAVADLLQLHDDLPLMPAVSAAVSVPTRLSDRASLAHLRAVAHAAGREALSDANKSEAA